MPYPPGAADRVAWRERVAGVAAGRYPTLARSLRAAILVPSAFAIATALSDDPQLRLFTCFAAFALLLFVDFSGTRRRRVRSYGTLVCVGALFMVLGTLCSEHPVTAIAGMAVAGFAVLFAGVVSSQVAAGALAALLAFVLPVSVAAPTGEIPARLGGWLLASALCVPAVLFVWPRPFRNELRDQVAATARALGRLSAVHADGRTDDAAKAAAEGELSTLRQQFEASTSRPTGPDPGATALARLVGRLEWVGKNAVIEQGEAAALARPEVGAVHRAVADVLGESAATLEGGDGAAVRLVRAEGTLASAREASRSAAVAGLASASQESVAGVEGRRLVAALDPTFRARALSFAASTVAEGALEAAAERSRTGSVSSTLRTARQVLASHLSLRSVWLRNSLRGAIAMALAVGVVEVTDVEHGFWVVLGTLSVLRSNALGTGATALRALAGTVIGFVIGSAVMVGIADHEALLWVVLPAAVLIAGIAPAAISFAAGQAAFTVFVVVLFNIIQPVGWRVGLTRVEDVAIGCAVSFVVGMLFWPRGATAALGRALCDACAAGSAAFVAAVDRLTVVDSAPVATPVGTTAAYERLDDAFRQYVWERGAKRLPAPAVTDLLTAAIRIHLAARSLATLPALTPPPDTVPASVPAAGAALLDACTSAHDWFVVTGRSIATRSADIPPVAGESSELHLLLVAAFDDACRTRRLEPVGMATRALWADEGLHDQLTLQRQLATMADRFTRRGRRS